MASASLAWRRSATDSCSAGSRGATLPMRRFDVTGTPIGSVVNLGPEEDAANAWIVPVPTGFLMVWGRDQSIEARLFDPDGVPLTLRYTVASGPPARRPRRQRRRHARGDRRSGAGRRARLRERSASRSSCPTDRRSATDVVIGPGVAGWSPKIASDPERQLPGGPERAGEGARLRLRRAPRSAPSRFRGLGTPPRSASPAAAKAATSSSGARPTTRLGLRTSRSARRAPRCAATVRSVPTCEICDDGGRQQRRHAGRVPHRLPASGLRRRRRRQRRAVRRRQRRQLLTAATSSADLETGVLCGDGVPRRRPVATSNADDANQVTGDGCSGSCQVEHIRGGGKLATDCWAAWRIDNPSNTPRYDKHGFINPRQACTDNDPACDFDGGVVGSCTFHLAVCANNSVPVECTPQPVCVPGRSRPRASKRRRRGRRWRRRVRRSKPSS